MSVDPIQRPRSAGARCGPFLPAARDWHRHWTWARRGCRGAQRWRQIAPSADGRRRSRGRAHSSLSPAPQPVMAFVEAVHRGEVLAPEPWCRLSRRRRLCHVGSRRVPPARARRTCAAKTEAGRQRTGRQLPARADGRWRTDRAGCAAAGCSVPGRASATWSARKSGGHHVAVEQHQVLAVCIPATATLRIRPRENHREACHACLTGYGTRLRADSTNSAGSPRPTVVRDDQFVRPGATGRSTASSTRRERVRGARTS